MASYSYGNVADFINATNIILSELQDDIEASSISSANVLYSIESGDTVTIYFDGTLSGPDITTLTSVVNAYTTGVAENIVTTTGIDNLSNKNLFTDTNYFIDPSVTTKRFGFLTSSANSGTTLRLASAVTADRTITFPDITDIAATLAASQILTNKTIRNGIFDGLGSVTTGLAPVYVAPTSTTASGSNTYYFTYFAQPAMTGSTTGSAYTMYIANAPSGTITTPYSLYVAAGKTYIGGPFQLPTGASAGYVLTSDANGNSSWTSPASVVTSFPDGLVGTPGIFFTNDTDTGFYRPTANQIGVALGGVLELLMTPSTFDLTTGNTLNVGTAGTSSPLNVYGLISGYNGLTITGANTSLTTLSTSALYTANAGITVTNGQALNVGSSGLTSALNIYGTVHGFGNAHFHGVGTIAGADATLAVIPDSTVASAANNYYFTYLDQPAMTGSTTGSAYTLYIANAPSGTITTPYAFYIAAGKSYINGPIQIPTGAVNNHVLTSDSNGNAVWQAPAIVSSFSDGTVSLPGISFSAQLNTGFYRPAANQIGISINGTLELLLKTSGIDITNGFTLNIGTSGTTSPLNVYGLITGSFGLTITSGLSSLQAITAAGLITANLGINVLNGQTVNIGSSGISSPLNVYGPVSITGKTNFTSIGNTTASDASVYIAPDSTTASAANNYYFTYLTAPAMTGSTTGSAYTMYISGAPTGTITAPWALYVNAGGTYLGGAIKIPTSASIGYVLTSDAAGVATWQAPSTVTTFLDGTVALPSIAFSNETNTGFYRPGTNQIGISINGTLGFLMKTTGVDVTNGAIFNIGTSGTGTTLNVYGLITGYNGLSITGANSSFTTLSTSGLLSANLGLTVTGANTSVTTLSSSGLLSANLGLTVTGANTSVTTLSASGLISANLGLTVLTGQTLNVGTAGSTSPLNVYGIITGSFGLTITGANTSLTTLSTSGLYTANAGITSANGQTVNIGTSGLTSILNINGDLNAFGTSSFVGTGNTNAADANVYIAPSSTAVSAANNYYFTYLTQPPTSGGTTGSAYTLYIAGEPTGFITNKYAVYVAGGNTYIGGGLQIPTGAANGYILTTVSTGVTSWTAPSALNISFPDGTVGAPGIFFTNDADTGFYRVTTNQIGVTLGGVLEFLMSPSIFELTTGNTLNVGTAGTTSPLNVWGLITGSNGLTITSGLSSLQAVTAAGLVTANVGINVPNGQIVNVGASGTSSFLNVYGKLDCLGVADFEGQGNISASNCTLLVEPASTPASGSNDYFFTYFTQPTLSGSTTGSAYTIFIEGEPLGTVTNKYALYVNSGNCYFEDGIQLPTGAAAGYLLKSNANGIATWVSPSLIAATFPDGTAALPGIPFTAELGTGFYRPAAGQIGVELSGANYVLFKTTSTDWINGSVVNIGVSGDTSTLNVYGDINGFGVSDFQDVVVQNLLTASGDFTIDNGGTINVGTSGLTSSILIRGVQITDGAAVFNGKGSVNAAGSTIVIDPDTTNLSGSSNYYFSNFTAPFTTGATTGSAYTVYIAGAPAGTIGNPYSIYIASGKTYIGDTLQIPTGAVANHVLISDASGNASWGAPTIAASFSDGTVGAPGISFTNQNTTGFYRPSSGVIGVSLVGVNYFSFTTASINIATGTGLNVGSTGTTSPANIYGLITGSNGLTISSGASSLQAITAAGLISANGGVNLQTGQTLNVGSSGTTSPSNFYGLITGSNGITLTSGLANIQALTTAGLITANAGITVVTGQTVNIGTTNTISPLNVLGLITGTNGLTITGANTSLTTLSTSGLISANGGITISTGNTLNVGTSSDTSPSNFWGLSTFNSPVVFKGVGGAGAASSSAYFLPSTTAITGSNSYYFSSFARPSTTGSTTGEASTVYIDGPPSGTITTPYSLFVNDGVSRFNGTIRYTTGAAANYVLQSNAIGNASWVDVATLPSPTLTHVFVATSITEDTTSETYVDIPSMTVTPNSGTYFVTFSAVARILTNNRSVRIRLAKDGLQIANTLAIWEFNAINVDTTVKVETVVQVNGSEIITAQFSIGGGIGTIRLTNQKVLTAFRLGA